MDINDLNEIFLRTARRIVRRQYRYFNLDRARTSEAEARHVFAKILDERKLYYGIEIPTEAKHSISGSTIKRSALTDLVIYGEGRSNKFPIWVEFKRGQPGIDMIAKDFIKMIMEPSILGVCFFHILPEVESMVNRSNERAKKAVIRKYVEAYQRVEKGNCKSKWFVLFILDCSSKQYYLLQKNNVCNIDSFENSRWIAIK